MKTKLTITHNGFHGYTTATIIVAGNPGDRVQLSPAQIKKLDKAGCGVKNCICGETLLKACEIPEPWLKDGPVYIAIPETGESEIKVNGRYPQR